MSTSIHPSLTVALLAALTLGSLGLLSCLRAPKLSQLAIAQSSPAEANLGATSGAISEATSGEISGIDVAQIPDPQAEFEGGELGIDLCVSLPDWQRPSDQVQEKQLQTMSRYGEALADGSLSELTKDWWNHEIFSFTTYGLSARTDPLYLSGIWTAMEDTWNCYAADQPDRMSRGELAEVWLIHHRLVDIQWQDNQYLMTVEPSNMGLQLVQFERQEQLPDLPITLLTTAGQPLAVMSGDW
ncbi:MAG: hypothetical protein HC922_02895 [Leptolyngbyaceae cyanobacterium SM2_3_12]|nr:hypothetical protein [Leptolyngbyaceae cyanobacterium SM2_3_12]